jgi:4-hydroxythreonine-4-phosphate dehydrogenase
MKRQPTESAPAHRPVAALTLGDVAGIGPEVAVRAALHPEVRRAVQPVLVGHAGIVERALRLIGAEVSLTAAAALDDVLPHCAEDRSDRLICWHVGRDDALLAPSGQIDPRAGQAAYDALIAAIDAALARQVAAVVTAPLHKESLRLAGHPFPGHTEILADRCGVREYAMMLHLPPGEMIRSPHGLSVAHVTLHTSIASVPGLLSVEKIRAAIRLLEDFLCRLGTERPRMGVCALNPHAGEHGLFGDEEERVIRPAVAAEQAGGIDVRGPFPADTLLRRAIVDAEFDGLVAMYHDQGHIPFKLVGFDRAVNVTLGLPIVRTSPSHGTAYDIAWRGIAREAGMRGAILTAAQLCQAARRERSRASDSRQPG